MSGRHLGTILGLLEIGECPKDCRSALFEILEGDDPDLKLRALEFTSGLVDGDPTALRHLELVEATGEPSEVRARAASALAPALEEYGSGWEDPYRSRALSRDGYRRVQNRLERVYRQAMAPKLVRRRVLEASARAPESWHRGAIRAAWKEADAAWRRTAVHAMGYVDGFEGALTEALKVDDQRIVAAALRSVANCGRVGDAAEVLVGYACSGDCSCECRVAAIEGLRFVSSRRARRVLDRLTDSPDDDVAGTAAWALDEWYIRHGSE
jgi:hypothetical protein